MTRVVAVVVAVASGCQAAPRPPEAVAPLRSATVWIVQDGDSARVRAEVAATAAQHERGLTGRSTLAADAGMLFVFDGPRSADDGFWMHGTLVPLDLAFIDAHGVVVRVLTMELCETDDPDDCPGYFPGVPYATALEVNRGWFRAHGLGEGAVVRVVR